MKEIRLHIRVMAMAAIVTVAAIGMGVGLSVALVKARHLPSGYGKPGTVATIVKIHAAGDVVSQPDPHQTGAILRN